MAATAKRFVANQAAFLEGPRDGDGEARCWTFEGWIEMAYSLAKRGAPPAKAHALEAQYLRLTDSIGPAHAQASVELVSLVVRDLTDARRSDDSIDLAVPLKRLRSC
jgi:hypothetical protein